MGRITANDRLIFTLIFSAILHLNIVLGVGFGLVSPPTNSPLTNLEITLVKQQTESPPEEADFFAQVNNEGGGETDEKSPDPSPETQVQSEPVPPAITQPPVETSIPQETAKQATKTPVIQETNKQTAKAIVQEKAERIVHQALEKAESKTEKVTPPKKIKLSVSDLKLPSQSEIALLEEQFNFTAKALSKRPKKRKISAATKEYAAAAYMKAWELKVERIGNFNYPQEARRKNINGSLMLTVDINPDGSVPPDGIVISRSSGHKVLDDAAVRIVRLGAPYAAIPKDVLQDNDMLTIIRTWKFETSRGLSTR